MQPTKSTLSIEINTALPPKLPAGEGIAAPIFEDQPHTLSFIPEDDSNSSDDDGNQHKGSQRKYVSIDVAVGSSIAGEFKGKAGTHLFLVAANTNQINEPRRILLLGLGPHADFNRDGLRRAAGLAVREAQAAHIKHLHLVLPASGDEQQMACAAAEGAMLGLYDNNFYQHQEQPSPKLERLTIIASEKNEAISEAVRRGRIVAESANWARMLADQPGLDLPPSEFARQAAAMAEEFGLRVETLRADEIKRQGMGGLWGVGKGSDEPPVLIVIRYDPVDVFQIDKSPDELWAFVGKGITFDTGGISLKPAAKMEDMKSDMAGGAAVLGAMRAIAALGIKRSIVAVVPSAENMPSGRSLKPGDIVKTLAGHTIEVVDTDAEGRLVLADAIAYARQLGAARIIDVATLTGSIIVALGDHRTGLFSNNDGWADEVQRAAERAGEPVWRMPVSDDYKNRIESLIADYKNYGGRPDATAAALLLSKFATADTPWVHLDIAGTAWHDDPQPHAPKGATGVGVRLLVELALEQGTLRKQ